MRNIFWGSALAVWLLALAGSGYWAYRQNRVAEGSYGKLALLLDEKSRDFCDRRVSRDRLALARLIDRVRPRILGLFEGKQEFPALKMEQVGPVFLRREEAAADGLGFEQSHWSWEDARGLYLKTQNEPDHEDIRQRWRDLDVSVRYLLEKDYARLLRGNPFLPPKDTEHKFRPQKAVRRGGAHVLIVKLDPGDFRGAEVKLERLFDSAWKFGKNRVRIEWVENDPAAFRVKANFRSSRSYVSHRERELVIANFAWIRTVAHELGHVLGFSDHYYSVWNGENCYYTQESRLSDLMSNSQRGQIGAEHWRLLDRAYPTRGEEKEFPYFFRDDSDRRETPAKQKAPRKPERA